MHKKYTPPLLYVIPITLQHTLAASFGGTHSDATSGGLLGDGNFSTDHGFAGNGGLLGDMPASGTNGHVDAGFGGFLGDE